MCVACTAVSNLDNNAEDQGVIAGNPVLKREIFFGCKGKYGAHSLINQALLNFEQVGDDPSVSCVPTFFALEGTGFLAFYWDEEPAGFDELYTLPIPAHGFQPARTLYAAIHFGDSSRGTIEAMRDVVNDIFGLQSYEAEDLPTSTLGDPGIGVQRVR